MSKPCDVSQPIRRPELPAPPSAASSEKPDAILCSWVVFGGTITKSHKRGINTDKNSVIGVGKAFWITYQGIWNILHVDIVVCRYFFSEIMIKTRLLNLLLVFYKIVEPSDYLDV